MNEEKSSSSRLPGPLRAITPDLRQVPGVKEVTKAAEGALNAVGIVSPHGRRVAAYTGAGLLGVAGLVEWPIALAGAAAVWLTQPRPEEDGHRGAHDGQGQHTPAARARTKSPAKTTSKTASKTTTAKSQAKAPAKSQAKTTAKSHSPSKAKTTGKATGKATTSGGRSRTASGTKATKRQPSKATAS